MLMNKVDAVISSNYSENHKIFLYHIINVSSRLCYSNEYISLSGPHVVTPGFDPKKADFSNLDKYEKEIFTSEYLCQLCCHIPVKTVVCEKCEALYCTRCAIYLQRLAHTRDDVNDLPKKFGPELVINCLKQDQYNDKHNSCLSPNNDHPAISALIVECNRLTCGYRGIYPEAVNHLETCNLVPHDDISLLSSLFDANVANKSIRQLADEYRAAFAGFSSIFKDTIADTEHLQRPEYVTSKEKVLQGRLTAQISDLAGPSSAEQSGKSLQISDRRLYDAIRAVACGQIDAKLLPDAIIPRKPKPTSVYSLEPKPSGYNGVPILHEIIRWPKDILASPDRPNPLTGLDFEACKYVNTLAFVRARVFKVLLEADIIVLHGQAGDIKNLFFTRKDYDILRHKIRDVGAYYNISLSPNGLMALQIASYLMFQVAIQGRKLHYAVQDAFFTLALYYVDMEAFDDGYENCRNNLSFDNSWPEVVYPPNEQMSALYQEYQNTFDDWPPCIKYRKWVKPRRLNKEDECLVKPASERRFPYTIPMRVFKNFYPS